MPFDPSVHLKMNLGPSVSALNYSRVIDNFMYIMNCTRPDVAYVIGKLRRYTSSLSREHWVALIRVLRYLQYILGYGIHYDRFPTVVEGYSDAN